MYTFTDRNDDELCLTPEGTASCMRLAFENNLIYDRGIKKIAFIIMRLCSGMKDHKKVDIDNLCSLELSLWVMIRFMMISI